MFRKTLLAVLALAPLFTQNMPAQDRGAKSGRIDVDNYAIDAEINPRTQTLTPASRFASSPWTATSPARRSS